MQYDFIFKFYFNVIYLVFKLIDLDFKTAT